MPKIAFRRSGADVVHTENTGWEASEDFLAAYVSASPWLTPSDLPIMGFVLSPCTAPQLSCCLSMSALGAVKSSSQMWFPYREIPTVLPSLHNLLPIAVEPCSLAWMKEPPREQLTWKFFCAGLPKPSEVRQGQCRSRAGYLKDHRGAAGSGLGDSADGNPPAGSALRRCPAWSEKAMFAWTSSR